LKKYEEDIKELVKRKKERKEKQLQTLKFLHSLGFDLIPQYMTENIINQINNSASLKAKFGFNKNIDLANGSLGFEKDSDSNSIKIPEQKAFAKFVNKMIS
jgi:hypothetical protein